MSVTYAIKFDVWPEKRTQFLALLNGVLDSMRHEPTFHEAILNEDPESEFLFLLYETWESHADVLDVQLHRPYRTAWHRALPELLRTPRDISIWQPLRSDRKGN